MAQGSDAGCLAQQVWEVEVLLEGFGIWLQALGPRISLGGLKVRFLLRNWHFGSRLQDVRDARYPATKYEANFCYKSPAMFHSTISYVPPPPSPPAAVTKHELQSELLVSSFLRILDYNSHDAITG